jgi:23S rRNA (guanosine2251-2'-O)-methyltransferase
MPKRLKKKLSTYLYGKNSVLERLQADPASIRKVFMTENFEGPAIRKLIESQGVACQYVGESALEKLKQADRLQGIVAEAAPFEYASFESLLEQAGGQTRSIIFLDSINDPHNLGSIVRIAACFGRFGVVIHEYGSCEVNDTVIHVASGGENYCPIAKVSNLANALVRAKQSGFWIAGAVVEGGQDIRGVSFPFPLCLVMGSEGTGIRYGVEKQFELKVTLPMEGAKLSFNVAMACSAFCYEIARQRTPAGG